MIPRLYPKVSYRGRFAPSPTGSLHQGSLVAALGSFLHARKAGGEWLLRIEDIDPPREVLGAKDEIIFALEAYGLTWDRDILYQSTRVQEYEKLLIHISNYTCACSRQKIKMQGHHIRESCTPGKAIRFLNQVPVYDFTDLFLGPIKIAEDLAQEDFLLKRSDGYFAYQLAVVLDDLAQGMTHIIRGEDLLLATGWQLSLINSLCESAPLYGHLPLVLDKRGVKLSKQNHAKPVNYTDPLLIRQNLISALSRLGYHPPDLSHNELLNWAIMT
ncbi:MAG: tRNA glutamyl-Q(34) synthetase GluQRS [Candidatus Cloacimonetes bacterium]|nr:tRNA glutamyl-Q(34) synthetase GluQRS [Candidatus Cloacimonadota bacterium]